MTILAWALFAMGLVVTLIVVAALYVAIKGPPSLKAKLGGERAIWIAGIGFPVVVLTVLLIWGLSLTARLNPPIDGGEMRIRVSGEMWWFRVDYLDAQGRVTMRDANEVHIPVGRPVVFELTSADVIHSFWVPNLSGKKDMIPGRANLLRVEAAQARAIWRGVRRILRPRACADGAGGGRASPGRLAALAGVAAARPRVPHRPRRRAGEALFMTSGCAACHRVAGTAANGLAGPDLSHVGSRRTLGAGIMPNNRGTMIGWIGDSQSIKPGNRMPSYDMLPARDTAAIAAWLETLQMTSESGFDTSLYDRFPTKGPRPDERAGGARADLVRAQGLAISDRGQQQLHRLLLHRRGVRLLPRGGHPGAGDARPARRADAGIPAAPRPTTSSSPCTAR